MMKVEGIREAADDAIRSAEATALASGEARCRPYQDAESDCLAGSGSFKAELRVARGERQELPRHGGDAGDGDP
jgi:hypothetical protein